MFGSPLLTETKTRFWQLGNNRVEKKDIGPAHKRKLLCNNKDEQKKKKNVREVSHCLCSSNTITYCKTVKKTHMAHGSTHSSPLFQCNYQQVILATPLETQHFKKVFQPVEYFFWCVCSVAFNHIAVLHLHLISLLYSKKHGSRIVSAMT